MAEENLVAQQEILATIDLSVEGVPDSLLEEVTPMEVILGESLLTPGLQTAIRLHSYAHNLSPLDRTPKNLDLFKNTNVAVKIVRPILKRFNLDDTMNINQVIYRLDNRKFINNNVEEMWLHACDQTLLNDAAALVSKLWKCTTPSAVVRDVLAGCAGAKAMEIEESMPARDYIAENIHPFQVVAQQGNAALDKASEPSFVHFMTYENFGTHKFQSLKMMCDQLPVMNFFFAETGIKHGYGSPSSVMTMAFPCDFDLLSDILNGIDQQGRNINTLFTFNPLMKMFNQFGSQVNGCGLGSGVVKAALSNMGSAANQNACPDYTSTYLQRRQARMALLEQDKIALRLTVPWNPILHAGKVINLKIHNKEDPLQFNYGTGDYLIVNLKHNIKYGGFSTTTMDCVSRTVGSGIV